MVSAPAAWADSFGASSEARTEGGVHAASLAFDGNLATSWAEAEDGPGAASWLELRMDRLTDVVSVSVWPGDLSQGWRSARASARPRTLTVTLGGGSGPDVKQQVRLEDIGVTGPQRVDVPIRGRARTVRITIDEAIEGVVDPDTLHIAEVALNFTEGEPHPWVSKIYTWMGGEEGVAPRRDNLAEIEALKAKAAGGGDDARGALLDLMDQAGDGAPYVRRWVSRYVPRGYFVHAIPPNQAAIDALLELRDPNAIPALERASLRVTGHAQARLAQQVEMFYAYQDLIGGPASNVPAWGRSGWSRGELRGFGEPLPVAVDQLGKVYVADVGNSRVQRFGATGGVERVYGASEADISGAWFPSDRKWYVTGSRPGTERGQLHLPLDVELLRGKTEDQLAVLDAMGRVQVFGPDGDVRVSFKAPVVNLRILSGVGGQAYLVGTKKHLVVVWGNNAWVYTLDGEEVNGWPINDGVPSAAVALKNGKLALAFDQTLVAYGTDGFRLGSILGETLPSGFEGWDVSLDPAGRLWVVTDTGWAIKYKKPGKIDYQVRLDEDGFTLPRFAVRDDVLYVTDGDRVRVFDALEIKAKAELAAEKR